MAIYSGKVLQFICPASRRFTDRRCQIQISLEIRHMAVDSEKLNQSAGSVRRPGDSLQLLS